MGTRVKDYKAVGARKRLAEEQKFISDCKVMRSRAKKMEPDDKDEQEIVFMGMRDHLIETKWGSK